MSWDRERLKITVRLVLDSFQDLVNATSSDVSFHIFAKYWLVILVGYQYASFINIKIAN